MINRMDSICQAVLKGVWPTARRTYEGNVVSSFYTTKLLDRTAAPPEEPSASPQRSKVKRNMFQKSMLGNAYGSGSGPPLECHLLVAHDCLRSSEPDSIEESHT